MPYVARSQFDPRLQRKQKRTKSSKSCLQLCEQQNQAVKTPKDRDTAQLLIKPIDVVVCAPWFVWGCFGVEVWIKKDSLSFSVHVLVYI